MTTIIDEQDALVQFFVENKTSGCCLIGSLLLKEMIQHHAATTVIEGWWVSDSFAGRHYWLEVEGLGYVDIGTAVLTQLFPGGPKTALSHEFPVGRTRIDNETPEERDALAVMEGMFKLYQSKGLTDVLNYAPRFIRQLCERRRLGRA